MYACTICNLSRTRRANNNKVCGRGGYGSVAYIVYILKSQDVEMSNITRALSKGYIAQDEVGLEHTKGHGALILESM